MKSPRTTWLALAAGLIMLSLMPGALAADDVKITSRLIWGSNGEKPKDTSIKEASSRVREKLASVFKWQSYYEVQRHDLTVTPKEPKRVRMSDRCEIEIRKADDGKIEVKLYGQGKLVVTKKQTLKPGELLVLAGDDVNKTAWFVVLSLAGT